MVKRYISNIKVTQLGMDDVINVYTFSLSADGYWITDYIEAIEPFNYIVVLMDNNEKNSVEFYHDPKGWTVVGLHDKNLLIASIKDLISLGRYQSPEKVEEIINYLLRIKRLNCFI